MNNGSTMPRVWRWLSGLVTSRTRLVVIAAIVVTVVLGAGVTRLEFQTGEDTMVASSSQVFKDNVEYQSEFGGGTMLILLNGDVRQLFQGGNLERLGTLEQQLHAIPSVKSVIGPLTAMRYGAEQLAVAPQLITDAQARETDPAKKAEMEAAVNTDAARMAAAGPQDLSNPAFVDFLLFGPDGTIRPSFRDTFLDPTHAMLMVRLEGNPSIDDQSTASVRVKDVVKANELPGFQTLTTGTPVLLKEINDYLQGGMAMLGLFAAAVMVVLLWLVFHARARLLPLLVVLIGIVWAFGAVGWLGVPLTLVTISGLPIFIGLGVDFAIQMHNRYDEERENGRDPEPAVHRSFGAMAPPLLVAMLAAAFGFLALRLSKVPMIKDFGLMLAVGVVWLVIAGMSLPLVFLYMRERGHPMVRRPSRHDNIQRGVRWLTSLPGSWVVPLLLGGVLVAGAGLVVEGRMPIQTEPERWVSQTGPAVTELRELRATTKFSDELDLMIEAPDVTSTDVAAWMERFGREEVQRHPALVRANSMPAIVTAVHGGSPTQSDLQTLLPITPPDIAGTLIGADHTKAALIFPVGDISLKERDVVIEQLKADLAGDLRPPEGTRVTPTGLAVIGQELVKNMEANRRTLALGALAFVSLWFLIRFRRVTHALLPLVPVVTALGVSTVVIYALGIQLTPLTTVAGPLVIAVATEFSVLVEARYVEERERGATPAEAIRLGLPRIGRAFVASGLTLIGGFGVLAVSEMPLLREFGVVVAIDVVVALLSTLVVLPPLLRWADEKPWINGFHPGDRVVDETPERIEASDGERREPVLHGAGSRRD